MKPRWITCVLRNSNSKRHAKVCVTGNELIRAKSIRTTLSGVTVKQSASYGMGCVCINVCLCLTPGIALIFDDLVREC